MEGELRQLEGHKRARDADRLRDPEINSSEPWRVARHVPLRHHRLVVSKTRIQRAAAFIAQLYRLRAKAPHSWRRAESVGRDISLADADLEQAIRDAEKAGLIQRRADDEGLIILTAAGRAAASQ